MEQLLLETGIRLDPEPGIFGDLDPQEEDIVLASIYENKLLMALLRKYAERTTKEMLTKAVMNEQYWKLRGQFFTYNAILFKAGMAYKKLKANEQNRT